MFVTQTGYKLVTSASRRPYVLLVMVIALGIVYPAGYMYFDTDLIRHKPSPLIVKPTSDMTSLKSTFKQQQQQQQQQQLGRNVNVLKVQSTGNFTNRVTVFNAFLSSLRAEELKKCGTAAWQRPTSSVRVVSGARNDYLQLLANYSDVTTVALPWLIMNSLDSPGAWSSLQDRSNLLILTYHEWTADDRLCSFIEAAAWEDAIYNRRCNRNIDDTVRPSSLQPSFLSGRSIYPNHYWPNSGNSYPANVYTVTPPYVFHMHIHRDAVVTELGDVYTDGLKLVLHSCRPSNDVSPALPLHLGSIPLYNEVFVVSQYWGATIFHRMAEVMPRIALLVDFLKANPEIRILALEVGGHLAELLEIIGVDRSRLITGVTRAKVVYQPRATACGFPNVQESQMLSQLYRNYIRRTFPS